MRRGRQSLRPLVLAEVARQTDEHGAASVDRVAAALNSAPETTRTHIASLTRSKLVKRAPRSKHDGRTPAGPEWATEAWVITDAGRQALTDEPTP